MTIHDGPVKVATVNGRSRSSPIAVGQAPVMVSVADEPVVSEAIVVTGTVEAAGVVGGVPNVAGPVVSTA